MDNVEAWVIGEHNLPPELMAYGNDLQHGMVLIRTHDMEDDQWQSRIITMTGARFEEEYEWL